MNEKLSLEEISWSALPFIAANVIALLLITYLEPISLLLPRLAGQIR